MIKKFKQFNEGINHLLVGPTNDEILNYYQEQYNNGKINLITFYENCISNGIKGGPTKKEITKYIENQFKTNKLDVITYYDYCYMFKLNCDITEDDILDRLNKYSKNKMLDISISIRNERCILSSVKRGANLYNLMKDPFLSKLVTDSDDELIIKKLLLYIIKCNQHTDKLLDKLYQYHIDIETYKYYIIEEYIKYWGNIGQSYRLSIKDLSESIGIDKDEFQIVLYKTNVIDIDMLYVISKREKLEKSFMYCFDNRKKLSVKYRDKLYDDIIHDYDLNMVKKIVNDNKGYNINKEYTPRFLFYYLIRNYKLDIFEYLFDLYKETELWNLEWLYDMISNDGYNKDMGVMVDTIDQEKIKPAKELIKKRMKEFNDKKI